MLTVADELRESHQDFSRLAGLEGIPVVRTGELPRVWEKAAAMRDLIRGRDRRAHAPRAPDAAAPNFRESLSGKIKRYVVSLFVLLPDEHKNWSLRAAAAAVRLIRDRRIACVMTSGPPFSTHVIGLVAKALTGARWIADFRDPWVDMLPDRFPHLRTRVSDSLERMMEAAVATYADSVVTTTERMRTAMAARYARLPEDKFVCITNSIDTDAFAEPPGAKYDQLTITYAGTLYFDRTPEPLFRAVGELVRTGRATARDIRIKLLGDCARANGVDTRALAAKYGLSEVVELTGHLPYSEAVRVMQRSHLLLMLAPERHRLVVPAKMYDYLGSGTAILAIAEPGATADLISQTECGRSFSAADSAGLAEYLASLLRTGGFRQLRNDPSRFACYHATRQTERLVATMGAPDTALAEAAVQS